MSVARAKMPELIMETMGKHVHRGMMGGYPPARMATDILNYTGIKSKFVAGDQKRGGVGIDCALWH